jgi:hypothetical protein
MDMRQKRDEDSRGVQDGEEEEEEELARGLIPFIRQ